MMCEYHAEELHRMRELDGIALAEFWPRAAAFALDVVIALVAGTLVLFLVGLAWGSVTRADVHIKIEEGWSRVAFETAVMVLYFGLTTFLWNGRTPGKRLFRIRVVSLVHSRMTLWHSVERALGYGAAALECGFGFLQFFIHPCRRTAQDRLAETIVVQESAYRARLDSSGSKR